MSSKLPTFHMYKTPKFQNLLHVSSFYSFKLSRPHYFVQKLHIFGAAKSFGFKTTHISHSKHAIYTKIEWILKSSTHITQSAYSNVQQDSSFKCYKCYKRFHTSFIKSLDLVLKTTHYWLSNHGQPGF